MCNFSIFATSHHNKGIMKPICHYLLLPALFFSLAACNNTDNGEDEPFIMANAPIGKTYTLDNNVTLTFESADSVSFRLAMSLNYYHPRIQGKAHYTFDNGHVMIENPLGNLDWAEHQELLPCILYMEGTFTAPDALETSNFNFTSPHFHFGGNPILRLQTFDPLPTDHYYIANMFTDLELDLNNDGIASTNLSEEWCYDKKIYDFEAPEHYSALISDGKGNIQANFCLPMQAWDAERDADPDAVIPLNLSYTCKETMGTGILPGNGQPHPKAQVTGMERIAINVFRLDLRLKFYDFKRQQWVETDAWAFFFSVI